MVLSTVSERERELKKSNSQSQGRKPYNENDPLKKAHPAPTVLEHENSVYKTASWGFRPESFSRAASGPSLVCIVLF